MKKESLSIEDRMYLKSNLKLGLVTAAIILTITLLIFFLAKIDSTLININPNYILLFGLVLGSFMYLVVNRRYIADLKYGYKEVQIRNIKEKKYKKDYEAGSSLGPSPHNKDNLINLSMRSYEVYSFVIGPHMHPVDKELWDRAKNGDLVRMEFAPKSQELLNIDLGKV